MRFWLAALVVSGCYGPRFQTGSPCDDMHPCPSGLACSESTSTCEQVSVPLDAAVAVDALDAYVPPGCVPVPEICGDGIDQDCNGGDCPVNDTPGGAIDVTAGGDFTATITFATDDASKPATGMFCGGTGGRDVFYTVHLTADETYYFDTFGSDFDSVIRVFHGPCTGGPAPNGTKCRDNAVACASTNAQGIFDLTAGDTCIVIDQASSAETTGSLKLRVERGHRTGSPLTLGAAVVTMGNTSTATDQQTGSCSTPGPDVGYYFTACPGQTLSVMASTCNATTTWDTALYLFRGVQTQVCNDDDAACAANVTASTISTTVTSHHLFYLVVDSGAAGVSGAYELDTTIQ